MNSTLTATEAQSNTDTVVYFDSVRKGLSFGDYSVLTRRKVCGTRVTKKRVTDTTGWDRALDGRDKNADIKQVTESISGLITK